MSTGTALLLKSQQKAAYEKILKFLDPKCSGSHFLLSGYAGTGKTFILKALSEEFGNFDCCYCTPTNKATKVVARTLGVTTSSCKTIYSLLGIKMVPDEDRLILEFPKIPVDISCYRRIYVDEAGMLNRPLIKYIHQLSQQFNTKWVFMGDPAQLPPVGEKQSKIWRLNCLNAQLEDVIRFDNELLQLATHIRRQIQRYPNTNLRLRSNHGETEGVWKCKSGKFIDNIRAAARKGLFTEIDNTKAVAWRNKTVERLNDIIRAEIYGEQQAAENKWLVGDRVTIAEPVQSGNRILAHIDDEGTISNIDVAYHSEYRDFDAYHLTIKLDEGRSIYISTVHEGSEDRLQRALNDLAYEAKTRDKKRWRDFWGLRNAFHKSRHSYAFTAHRSQGSTFRNVFLDTQDILSNSNSLEALKCLYVGGSRATTKVILT